MMNTRKTGAVYETLAAEYLKKQGYRILAQNFRTPFGEIDIIAQKDGTVVYVEVKYRKADCCGNPLEAVDKRKQRQISRVANYHYASYAAGREIACRFDVIGISGTGELNHIENAFYFQG